MSARKSSIQEKLNRPNNFIMRREEIARLSEAAFHEKGYVQTSLRDIANHTGISLGSLTYHFSDRAELIQFCATQYKLAFIEEIEALCETATRLEDFAVGFIDIMIRAVHDDGKTHSLWYQAKSQSLFDDTFTNMVADIENRLEQTVVDTLATAERLSGKTIGFDRLQAYWLLDNMFQHYLHLYINGEDDVNDGFRSALKMFFGKTLAA